MGHPPAEFWGIFLELSVVIPLYNEVENLRPLHQALRDVLDTLDKTYEMLLVDDGSTDGSARLVSELAAEDERVRALFVDPHSGQTAALAAGFAAARGEIVVTMDADLQNDPADIPRLLKHLDGYDVVCGIRQKRHDTWIRRISSKIANGVRNWATGDDIVDTGCSLKAYRRSFLQRVKLFDGMHRFLPTLLKLEGARVVQIPVNHRPRVCGQSKYNVWNRVFRATTDLLAVRWMQKRYLRYRVKEDQNDRRG